MGPVVHTNVSPEYGQKLMVVDEQLFMLAVDEDNGWQLNLFDESNLLSNDFLDLFSDDSEGNLSTFWEWFSIESRVFYRNSSHSLGMINARSASHQSFADVLAQNEAIEVTKTQTLHIWACHMTSTIYIYGHPDLFLEALCDTIFAGFLRGLSNGVPSLPSRLSTEADV